MAWPLVVGAALGAASGALSYFGNRETNKTNKQIATEANDLQAQMFHEANDFNRNERLETQDFNRKMWYEEQAYNSPSMQAERLRQAGLNPSALLGGDSASAYGSVQSSPASSAGVPSAHVAQMENTFDPSVFNGTIEAFLNAADKQQDIKGKQIDNETRMSKNLVELQNLKADYEQKLADTSLSRSKRDEIFHQIKMVDAQIGVLELNRNRMQIENQYTERNAEWMLQSYADQHNESLERVESSKLSRKLAVNQDSREFRRLNADLGEIAQRISLMAMQEGLTGAQIQTEVEKQVGTYFDNIEKSAKAGQTSRLVKFKEKNKLFQVIDDCASYVGKLVFGQIKLKF